LPGHALSAGTLVITNGDAALERLAAAGVTEQILPWRDALHDGPVPSVPADELARIRTTFLAEAFGALAGNLAASFAHRDATLVSHRDFARIEVWLEHDLYDQLQLLQILDRLAALGRTEGVWLVQAADYLGLMSEEAICALAARAAPVTAAQFDLARRAWAAFTASTPTGMVQLISGDLAPLPWLPPALRRLLSELPDRSSGLALSESRILEALLQGPMRVPRVFAAISAREEARFMGDASFFRWLDGLAFGPEPVVSGLPCRCPIKSQAGYDDPRARAYLSADISATPFGTEVLAGRADHARANPVDRWLGGTHLSDGRLWRWHRGAEALVAPV
jgi:hypothetical protein